MTLAKSSELGITHLPDHTELPESDGTFVSQSLAEHQLALQLEQEQQRAERLRQLGIDPNSL